MGGQVGTGPRPVGPDLAAERIQGQPLIRHRWLAGKGARVGNEVSTGLLIRSDAGGVNEASSRGPEEGFIQVRKVSKTYPGRGARLVALEDISFTVKRSTFVSIVGPSGCGKSTLLMIIAGLRMADDGEGVIGGVRVNRPYTDLGMVFQRDTLLEWRTVLANVMLPIEIRGLDRSRYLARARELLETVGLQGFETYYPRELSGGMRQRLSLCRALVHDPPILLMDEPFGSLDAMTRDLMGEELQNIWFRDKKTVLFVTHSIAEAVFLSDKIIVMSPRPGRVVEEIDLALPRPRSFPVRESPEFVAYVRHIRELLERAGAFDIRR